VVPAAADAKPPSHTPSIVREAAVQVAPTGSRADRQPVVAGGVKEEEAATAAVAAGDAPDMLYDPFVALAAVPLPGCSPPPHEALQVAPFIFQHGLDGGRAVGRRNAGAGGLGGDVRALAIAGGRWVAGADGAGWWSMDGTAVFGRSRGASTGPAAMPSSVSDRRSLDGQGARAPQQWLRRASSFTPSAGAAVSAPNFNLGSRLVRVTAEAPPGKSWHGYEAAAAAAAAAAGGGSGEEGLDSMPRTSTLLTAFSDVLRGSFGGSGGGRGNQRRSHLGGGGGGSGGLARTTTLREAAELLSCDGVSDDATVLDTVMEVVGGRQSVEDVMTEDQRAAIRRYVAAMGGGEGLD
jgi:hypothetical protein